MNAGSPLPEPLAAERPPLVGLPRGRARLVAATEEAWWTALEFIESAGQGHAVGLSLAGSEKHSGLPLRLFYFGSGNHLAWVRSLLFRTEQVEEQRQALRPWQAGRWIRELGTAADLVIADLPWPWHLALRGRGLAEVPAWVNQRMRLPRHWPEVLPRLRRSARGEDLRNIRKQRLEYRLVRDEAAIRRFYEELYVPHLTRRFGAAAYIEPEWKVRWCIERGTLMEIRRAGELVAAQVLWPSRRTLQFLWAGTAGEEFSAGTRGAFPALYYYGILHAFENGFDEVDYCGSRPLLSDGIFQLKRRWGAAVHDGWSRDTLFLGFRHHQGASLEVVARHPLIVRACGGLVGKLHCGTAAVTAEHVERARQTCASDGLGAIHLYSLAPPAPAAIAAARAAPGIDIVDLSGGADPASEWGRR